MPGPIGNGSRPYLNASIVELVDIVELNRTNTTELKRLLAELHYRSTPKAKRLRDRIRQLVGADDQDDLLSGIQPELWLGPSPDRSKEIDPFPKPQPEPVPSASPKQEAGQPAAPTTKAARRPTPETEQAINRDAPTVEEEVDEADAPPSIEDLEACKILGVTPATEWTQVESRRRSLLRGLVPSKDVPDPDRLHHRKEADRINRAFLAIFRSRCSPRGTAKTPPAAVTDDVLRT